MANILKGPEIIDPAKLLSQATPDQINALTHTSFPLWAQLSGIKPEGRPFDFDNHRYLLPIYLDTSHEIVWQKAAQLGATIYMLLRLIWFCRHYQVNAGMYFPTEQGVRDLSKGRLGPLIESCPDLKGVLEHNKDTLGLKQIKNIYDQYSNLYMLYLGGKASKDSVPLDLIGFDEVRLVNPEDVDQAIERISHSSYKYKMFLSTCGLPGDTINRRFLGGSQHTYYLKCQCIDGGFAPSDCFPDCIVETKDEVYLRCPRCKYKIQDRRNGFYMKLNSKADYSSYQVSQLCSPHITVKEIWDFYKRTTNKQEFFNAKLGIPYLDKENQPITLETLEASQDLNLRWANDLAALKDRKQFCAMGVDQGRANHVVIAKRGVSGRKEIVHFEVIESDSPRYTKDGKFISPFARLYELMNEFDVKICVIDAQPNHNDAMTFALAFPGRVFLAWYGESGTDMVKWHDKLRLQERIRKGSKDIKIKWQVTLNRYMSIDYLLKQWADGAFKTPNIDALHQLIRNPETGIFEEMNIGRTQLWKHMKSIIRRQKEIEAETGRFKYEWFYTDGDPHSLHAANYANIALERMRRLPIFTSSTNT